MFCREKLTRVLAHRTYLALYNFRAKRNMSRDVTWKDVSINLDWGSVAGKTTTIGKAVPGRKILGIHGWLDNANSFDALAPYLPTGTELLTLDLPGHGLSDHLPPGCQYDVLTQVLNIKRAVDKYGWSEFILLGHSLGGGMCNFFTSLFPENVVALVTLDSARIRNTNIHSVRESAQNFFKGEKLNKQKPLLYTEEEAIDRLLSARNNMGMNESIDRDTAYKLLPRSAKQVDNGYEWTHDPRARATFMSAFNDSWKTWVESIKCPVLIVMASKGLFGVLGKEIYMPFLDIYRRNIKHFEAVTVEGTHYVHLNNPERLAKPILEFIDRVLENSETI